MRPPSLLTRWRRKKRPAARRCRKRNPLEAQKSCGTGRSVLHAAATQEAHERLHAARTVDAPPALLHECLEPAYGERPAAAHHVADRDRTLAIRRRQQVDLELDRE